MRTNQGVGYGISFALQVESLAVDDGGLAGVDGPVEALDLGAAGAGITGDAEGFGGGNAGFTKMGAGSGLGDDDFDLAAVGDVGDGGSAPDEDRGDQIAEWRWYHTVGYYLRVYPFTGVSIGVLGPPVGGGGDVHAGERIMRALDNRDAMVIGDNSPPVAGVAGVGGVIESGVVGAVSAR